MIFALWQMFLRLPRWIHIGLAGTGVALAFKLWLAAHDANIRREQKELDRAAYEQALQEAELLAIQAKADAEQHYRRLADETDERAAQTVADARTAADRYIERMRAKGCGGATSPTIAAASGGGAQSDNGTGPETFLVPVTEGDVRICSENTARLIEAREWALGLVVE